MRPGFRKSLERPYGTTAKKELALDEREAEANSVEDIEDIAESRDALDKVSEMNLAEIAKNRNSTVEAQREIFDIQKKKQKIMAELKADIKALDGEQSAEIQEAAPDSYLVKQIDGGFVRVEKGGQENEITKGEILTDGEWGIEYHFDETVSRNLHKRYLIEKAKRKLQNHLDEQIIKDELSNKFTDKYKRKTYERILNGRETGEYETFPGLVAERLVKNLFKKLCYDFDLPVKIVEADIFQDVEQKVDFIMHRLFHYRGVGVEDVKKGDVGVQFTINESDRSLKTKERQITRAKDQISHSKEKYVEDIILVSIPIKEAADMYDVWVKQGKLSGGPDKLWNLGFKEIIFRGVLEGVMSEEELEKEWEAIRKGEPLSRELPSETEEPQERRQQPKQKKKGNTQPTKKKKRKEKKRK